ncbi:MAG: hypothetical protein ACI81W_003248, partial [Saprospiraceae bacterium]
HGYLSHYVFPPILSVVILIKYLRDFLFAKMRITGTKDS